MSVYTKTGDLGTTGMLSGRREKKNHILIQLNGHIDELTSHLGLVKTVADQDIVLELSGLQRRFIEIMAYISSEFSSIIELREDIARFENRIDQMTELFPKQTEFIIPGATEVSARLDIARAVARRTERLLVSLDTIESLEPLLLKYMNRLSDYLYTMARMLDFREVVKKQIMTEQGSQAGHPAEVSHEALCLESARYIVEKTIAKAKDLHAQVVVCVVGRDGLPMIIEKMDDAFPISFDLSRKKAYTSAVLKMTTSELKELTKVGGDFEGLEHMIEEEIVTLGGGCPIKKGPRIIGAIGVSGGTLEEDEALAKYGAQVL